MKYSLPERSKLRSVSPPPGGDTSLWVAAGGASWLTIRNVCPLSKDPSHMLRCVPVPVGPLAKTSPVGESRLMDGSPKVWIGSTTVGTEKPIAAAGAGGAANVE